MKKIKKILEVHLIIENEDNLTRIPLKHEVTSDSYWKQSGIFKESAISSPGRKNLINNSPYPTVRLQRTGKTIVDRFAGFVANPNSIDLLVLLEDNTQMLVTFLRTPRGDNVSAKEGYMVKIYEPKETLEEEYDND